MNKAKIQTIQNDINFWILQIEVMMGPFHNYLDNKVEIKKLCKNIKSGREQIIKLMNIVAEEIYVDKFDTSIGTNRIESKLQKGEMIPENHLIAFRMSKEEILNTWLKFIQQIIKNHFIFMGTPINEAKLFQYPFPPELWNNVRTSIRSLRDLPLWINRDLSYSVFGGKQTFAFWQTIFETGTSPSGQEVLTKPINLMDMMRE